MTVPIVEGKVYRIGWLSPFVFTPNLPRGGNRGTWMLRYLRVGNIFDGARLSVERCLVLLRSVEIELATLQRTLVLRSEICFGFGQRLERSR